MRRDDELLTAYVDGVTELTPEERRAVEARIAGDDALRAEAEETRALLERLRGERAADGEPDWAALERSILDAVGPDVPRPWWRRLGWRWAMPVAALAAGAAILALVLRTPPRPIDPGAAVAVDGPAAQEVPPVEPAPASGDTVALWLDGEDVEVELDAEALLEVPWESDHNLEELLPASDLVWVDELVEEELAAAEALLQDPELEKLVRRKRS